MEKKPFSLLVVSIPKSGTVYMNAMFRTGLGLDNFIMSNRYFPEDQLYLDAMPEFAQGGHYVSAHIDPSPTNLQILDVFVPKWVVHFRDPRSVLLSWVHHVQRYAELGDFQSLLRVTPAPTRDLHLRSFEERVDWHIEHFLPAVTKWMTDWLVVCDRLPQRILVTEFAALKEHEDVHVGQLLDFFGIERSLYRHRPPEKSMSSHFRTGTYDEWRTSFTSEQIGRATAAIPQTLFDRFGWKQ